MYQLSPTDALMLFMESDPTPNQVSLVLILDQSTAPRGQVRFKGIMAKMESAIEYAPNFGCRLVRVPISLRSKETTHNPSGNELVPHNVPLCTHIDDPWNACRRSVK